MRWKDHVMYDSHAGWYCNNPVYDIDGVEVTYWIFEMSGKSLNLFANGTVSDKYLHQYYSLIPTITILVSSFIDQLKRNYITFLPKKVYLTLCRHPGRLKFHST